ncbi:MAG: LytR C-terminal domain-containing protein [Candidatus Helarchaeota archaeon]|nr:LytR C-terminal domain-containing protein [Candidatus Helarchaeota archaeon]
MVKRKRRKVEPKKRVQDFREKRDYKNLFLNVSFLFSIFLVIYLSYSLIRAEKGEIKDKQLSSKVDRKNKELDKDGRIYKIQVLNGCGVDKIAERFTNFLRQNGFDVIETGNYTLLGTRRSNYYFNMRETIVIGRSGKPDAAKDVARVLGTDNVVKQFSTDLMVDVTVIIGKDYKSLSAYK